MFSEAHPNASSAAKSSPKIPEVKQPAHHAVSSADLFADLLNPIKHSHPPIGYTSHRIDFEPVKLTAHSSEAPQPKERPPMFARDVIPTAKPATKSKAKAKAPVIASSPPPEDPSIDAPPIPAPAKPSKRAPAKSAVRRNPLSSDFEIPLRGEITADGIPRIDGEKVVRKKRKPKAKAAAAAAPAAAVAETSEQAASPVGSHGGLMQIDESEVSNLQAFPSSPIAGPSSSLPAANDPPIAGPSTIGDPPSDTETQRQRVLLPDAPRGYTKRGLPRRKPGPAKGHRKASTIAKEVGGVVSMLTGKLPEEETEAEPSSTAEAMEVDPDNQEPEVEHGNLDPAIM